MTFAGSVKGWNSMSTAAQLLEGKEGGVLSIDADATVYEAVERMVGANVGALLVEVDGRINGIFTERDYLRRVTLEGRTDKECTVREIMTSPLLVVSPETSVDECMSLMTERRIRHLPVASRLRPRPGLRTSSPTCLRRLLIWLRWLLAIANL